MKRAVVPHALRKHARRALGMSEYCASEGAKVLLLVDVRVGKSASGGAKTLVGRYVWRTLRSANLAREVARQFPAARALLAGLPAEYVLEHVIAVLADPPLSNPSDAGTEGV